MISQQNLQFFGQIPIFLPPIPIHTQSIIPAKATIIPEASPVQTSTTKIKQKKNKDNINKENIADKIINTKKSHIKFKE